MTVIYMSLIFLLLFSHLWWYRVRKNLGRELEYIHQKLNQIIKKQSRESLLLFTEDPQLQRLLIDINRLLQHSHQTITTYTKFEQSIREMLTNMSHDLKTPLTVILGLSETLARDPTLTEPERDRLLKKIHEKAQVIHKLMNQFFDLAKLESGDMIFSFNDVELNEICRKNILFFYETITTRELEIAIDIPESPIYSHIDPDALNRILKNLISNAIKYGSDGKILGIRLRSDFQHAYIDVWDRGKGIPKKDQDLIFERLYTLNDSPQGSGLGLAITKRLTEKLGGTLTFESQPYQKTIFTIQLNRLKPTSLTSKEMGRFS